MPHGESWLTLLLKRFFPGLHRTLSEQAQTAGGWPFKSQGSWYVGQEVTFSHVLGLIFVMALISVIVLMAHRKLRNAEAALVPDATLTTSSFIEMLGSAVYGMMADIMGPKAAKFFLPLIGTCAFLIFFSNAIGLIPGLLPPTENLNTTLACAVVIFLATHIFGVKEHGLAYFKHFFGPIIKWYALPLMILMFFIEVISHLVRPLSLSIRLMANIFADHVVIGVFLGLLGSLALFIPIPAIFMLLGCVVVVVQTLVFCILSTVYISMAIEHAEH